MIKAPLPSLLASLIVAWGCPGPAAAAVVEVSATQTGAFYADGSLDNGVGFQNYFVGYGTTPGFSRTAERRCFFVFDLTAVTSPVSDATLGLYLPFEGLIGDEPVELFMLTGTPFSHDIVTETALGPGTAMAIFGTFGMGAPVADVTPLSEDDEDAAVTITLNGTGLAAVNGSLGGFLVLTGRMSSWSEEPEVDEPHEVVFAHSDVVSPFGSAVDAPLLTLTTIPVPEPEHAAMVAGGLALLAGWRRWRRSFSQDSQPGNLT